MTTPATSALPAPASDTIGSSADPLATEAWTPYTSERYGFSIRVPSDWTVTPASHDWTLEADASDILGGGAERFARPDPRPGAAVTAWAVDLPADADLLDWVEVYCAAAGGPSCIGFRDRTTPVSVDGREGLIVDFPDDTQAFIRDGDRLVVVAVWRPESHQSVAAYGGARTLLETFLSTMQIG